MKLEKKFILSIEGEISALSNDTNALYNEVASSETTVWHKTPKEFKLGSVVFRANAITYVNCDSVGAPRIHGIIGEPVTMRVTVKYLLEEELPIDAKKELKTYTRF